MKAFFLTVSGLVLAVLGFEFGNLLPSSLGSVVGWLGTVASVWGAFLQYVGSRPFAHLFVEEHWRSDGNEFALHIPLRSHAKGGSAVVVVYRDVDGVLSEVSVASSLTKDGGVVVRAVMPFAGVARVQ